MGRILGTALIAGAGGLLAWGTAAVVAGAGGSPPSLTTVPEWVIAAVGVATALAWGWVFGSVTRSYVTAAGLPVLAYLAIWLVPAYATLDPLAFTGATMLGGTAAHLKPMAVVCYLAIVALGLGAALCLLLVVTRDLAVGHRAAVAARCGGVACLVGASLAQLLGPVGPGRGVWQYSGPWAWDCHQVAQRSTACLPKDLGPMATSFREAMSRVDPKLRLLLPEGTSVLYTASETASAEQADVLVHLENDLVDPEGGWAIGLTTFVSELADSKGDCLGLEQSNEVWLSVMLGVEVPDRAVLDLPDALAGCG